MENGSWTEGVEKAVCEVTPDFSGDYNAFPYDQSVNSPESTVPITVTFDNQTPDTFQYYWYDSGYNSHNKGTTQGNDTLDVDTYVTHAWKAMTIN